jgi:hypothetical protein
MSTKNYLKHTVTDTPPTFSDVGDEYYSPRTNILYKKVVYNGTNVAWSQIVTTGTDGNITLTGNSISFLANNKYPIYFGSTLAPSLANNIYVGINTSGYINGGSGPMSGVNTLPIFGQRPPEANVSIFFQPRGYGGILTSVPDPTYSNSSSTGGHPGGPRGFHTVDLQLGRTASSSVAAAQYSALLGGFDNSVSGQYAVGVGGAANIISGSFAAAVGGQSNNIDGEKSVILGGNYAWCRGITFYNVITNSGILFGSAGSSASYAQGATMSLGGSTSAAAPTRMITSDGSTSVVTSSGSRNVLFLPNNSLFGFKGSIVAAVTGAAANAMWTFEGSISRGANAASTSLLGIPTISVMSMDSVASTNGWYISITADKTNGALNINVKGDPTLGVRWYCRLETTEVAYS